MFCRRGLLVSSEGFVGIITGPTGVFLSGEGDLVEDELGDWVGEFGSHWEDVRLGLEAVLVGNVSHNDLGTVRSSVTGSGIEQSLDKEINDKEFIQQNSVPH